MTTQTNSQESEAHVLLNLPENEAVNAADSRPTKSTGSKVSKVFSVRLPLEQAANVENLATARGVSPSRLLALMLDDYLNQQARITFAEDLLRFEMRAVRREAGVEKMLVSFDSRLEKFEQLLLEAVQT